MNLRVFDAIKRL